LSTPRVQHWDVPDTLFDLFADDAPPGFRYRKDFITTEEETSLADEISRVAFSTFEMRGVVARRRVAFFGMSYGTGGAATSPMPPFLMPLRDKAASWADVQPEAFVMALINEYTPGAPIGWHRDAPQYGIVAGISLLSSCRIKFRPYLRPGAEAGTPRRTATHEVTLERRSAYLLTGESRSAYEHHIPPASVLRYSVTFRTLRSSSPPSGRSYNEL
jgi:alkylated DNA repair dioxygenase AlkB